ncbi:anionic trypsin-2-like [Lutzomyia longipalpis]|uniref:anionic trypsin-2-like n=1 Tax=Lutzomyia longipalpis TaxID=7200 RepID=UPI00248448A5|nr:anionic trypsin-2-like [Lutzomyia longipalpis]
MLKFAIILAVIGSSLGGPVETVPEVPETFVHGGTEAPDGAFPWTASVRVHNDFFQGVVINENHILTAASVVTMAGNAINHFWVRVAAGDRHIIGSHMNREERTLSHLFIHDLFNHQTGVNNIAVLRLAHPFQFPHNTIEGAVLHNRIIPVGTNLQFAGWQIPVGPPAVRLLRSFNLPVITTEACTSPAPNQNIILDNQICAGHLAPAPPASVCQGNMGGGVYFNRELVGILGRGFACGAVNNPAIFTEVRFYTTWINQQFTRTDVTPPGTTFPRQTPQTP